MILKIDTYKNVIHRNFPIAILAEVCLFCLLPVSKWLLWFQSPIRHLGNSNNRLAVICRFFCSGLL